MLSSTKPVSTTKKGTPADPENKKLAVTHGEREGGRGNMGVGDSEVQIVVYKVNYEEFPSWPSGNESD